MIAVYQDTKFLFFSAGMICTIVCIFLPIAGSVSSPESNPAK